MKNLINEEVMPEELQLLPIPPNDGERHMIYATFDRILAGDDAEAIADFVRTYQNAHIRRYMRTNVIRRVRMYLKTGAHVLKESPRTGGNQ